MYQKLFSIHCIFLYIVLSRTALRAEQWQQFLLLIKKENFAFGESRNTNIRTLVMNGRQYEW